MLNNKICYEYENEKLREQRFNKLLLDFLENKTNNKRVA